jgi:Ser/Thr protein kinase RdoA (MazF antagonist)
MNPHNVLVREDNPDELAGVLDFGDALVAPLVNDVAVAAAYETSGPGSAIDGITQFVAAYHVVVPLQRDELEIVVDLVAARQVLTAVITEWRAQRYPENRAYILRNNPAAWLGLAGLAGEPREDSIGRVLSACGVSR